MSEASLAGAPIRLPAWAWAPRDRKTLWFCAILVGVCVGFLIASFRGNSGVGKPYLSGDFFALWSYPKVAFARSAVELYEAGKLHEAQLALGMSPQEQAPFPYPPTFLLALWPLRLLSYNAAYVGWVGVTLLLCLLANCAGARGKRFITFATLIAPSTTACLVCGQSGFLLAALLVGGLRLLPHRPILAGMLFGLLTYKPQFGILLPVALVAAGQWRCIAAACATTAGLVAVTIAAFGASAWEACWRALPAYAAWFDALMAENPFMPTVLTNLQRLGAPPEVAQAAQAGAALAAAIVVWRAWRQQSRLAVPALLAATCLATPHAFVYDLPLLSSAVFLFAAHRLRSTGSLLLPEIAVLVLVLAIPATVAFPNCRMPVSTIAIGLFLALILAPGSVADLGHPMRHATGAIA